MDLGTPVTGEIIFRRAVGETYPEDYSRRGDPDPWTYSLGVGLLHVPPGSVTEERVLGVGLASSRGGMVMGVRSGPAGLNRYDDEHVGECDLGGVFTVMQVRPPEGFGALMAHGGLFLRRTRFPGPEGTETYAVAAIMRTAPGQLAERTMYRLDGTLGSIGVVAGRHVAESYPVGSVPSGTTGLPIWQSRDGRRSLYSTLRLDAIDACNEARALERVESPTAEQADRLRALRGGVAGSVMNVGRTDPSFQRFKALAVEMGDDIDLPYDTYPTASELAERSRQVGRVMEAFMAEGPSRRFR